jgi:hypothetical protein
LDVVPTEYKPFFSQNRIARPEEQAFYYYAVTGWEGMVRQIEAGKLQWLPLKKDT